jgi:hypothetical protein
MCPDSRARRRYAVWAALAALAAAFAWVYLPSLRIGFVADDFDMLCKPGLAPTRDWYRFSPVGVGIWHWLASFEHKPGIVRLVAVLLHAVNTVLVIVLANRLTRSLLAGVGAGIVFFAQRQLHQVVFWNSAAFFYMPMTAAFLLGCLLATTPPGPRPPMRFRYLVAYPLLSVLAAFSHESGIFFLPAVVGLEIATVPIRGRTFRQWAAYLLCWLPAALPPLALAAVKSRMSQPMSWDAGASGLAQSAVHAAAAIFGMAVHLPSSWVFLAGWHLFVVGALVALLGAALLMFLAWRPTTRQAAALAFVVALIPFMSRLCSEIQDRFLYLPTALFSVVLVTVAAAAGRTLFPPPRAVSWSAVLAMLLAAGLACREAAALARLRGEWQSAGDRTRHLIEGVIAELDRRPSRDVQKIYLVNPPPLCMHTNMLPVHPVNPTTGLEHGIWLAMRAAWERHQGQWHLPVLAQVLRSPDGEQQRMLKEAASDPKQVVIEYGDRWVP